MSLLAGFKRVKPDLITEDNFDAHHKLRCKFREVKKRGQNQAQVARAEGIRWSGRSTDG